MIKKIALLRIIYCLPAFLPVMFVFLNLPSMIYFNNQRLVHHQISFLIPYLGMSALVSGLLLVVLGRLPIAMKRLAIVSLFWAGIFFGISDMLYSWSFADILEKCAPPDMEFPVFLQRIKTVMPFAVAGLAVISPGKMVHRFGVFFMIFLLPVSLGSVGIQVLNARQEYFPEAPRREGGVANSGRHNIYHLTFDAMGGPEFERIARENNAGDSFEGFTFFKTTLANYVSTIPSVASFMTGSLYRGGSMKKWVEEEKQGGVIRSLYEKGYEVSMYAPVKTFRHSKAANIMAHWDLILPDEKLLMHWTFADWWLLRLAAFLPGVNLYRGDKGVFTRLFNHTDLTRENQLAVFVTVRLLNQLIMDEALRPATGQYVYAHIHIPHGPFVLDSNCKYHNPSTYEEQNQCAVNLMKKFINRLKELGRYDSSAILFQSDHGQWSGEPAALAVSMEMPETVREKIKSIQPASADCMLLDVVSKAFLAVKPPFAGNQPLVSSDVSIQLADVPVILNDLAGENSSAGKGTAFLLPLFSRDRTFPVYCGFAQGNQEFGRHRMEGKLFGFSYGSEKGWNVEPDIHVRWR